METEEKPKAQVKSNKKNILIGGLVVVICGAAALYFTGAGASVLKSPSKSSGNSKNQIAANTIKRPDRNPDIVGLVESVSGNEVKILELNAADVPGAVRNTNGTGGSAGAPSGANQNQAGGNAQGTRPQGNWQGGQAGNGQAASAARAAMIAELKKKSIGEETITVPVGIQMIKMGGGGQSGAGRGNRNVGGNNAGNNGAGINPANGNNAAGNNPSGANRSQMGGGVAATLADLTADKTVMIWLNAKVTDKKVAEFVSIGR